MSLDVEPVTPSEPPTGARLAADLVDVDLTSGRSFFDGVPHRDFDTLRSAGGVAWHAEPPPDPAFNQGEIRFVESPGFWVVTSHQLVSDVLRNQALFSSQLGGTTMPSLAPESLAMFRQMMLLTAPGDSPKVSSSMRCGPVVAIPPGGPDRCSVADIPL